MGKQILVITGSPRKQGNSDLLADAFIKGAKESGHEAVKFISAEHSIKGCLGCKGCWSKGTPCVQDDDVNSKLFPLLADADVLVFCTPLYSYTFPTQIKAPLDRFMPFGTKPLKVKETALIVCGADNEEGAFHAIIESYKHFIGYFGWKSRGELIVLNVDDKGEVKDTDGLKRAGTMGREI